MSAAFDTLARTYDQDFTTLARPAIAAESLARARRLLRPRRRGARARLRTGEDALHLARRGVRIAATDGSPAMLRGRAQLRGMDGVRLGKLDLTCDLGAYGLDGATPALPTRGVTSSRTYDGAYSSFGVLNCVPDRRRLSEALGTWVRPGGRLVLVVMGPLCLWELGWHLLHTEVRTATRRLRPFTTADLGDGSCVLTIRARRDSNGAVARVRPRALAGLGVLLPPSHLAGLTEKHPKLFSRLSRSAPPRQTPVVPSLRRPLHRGLRAPVTSVTLLLYNPQSSAQIADIVSYLSSLKGS